MDRPPRDEVRRAAKALALGAALGALLLAIARRTRSGATAE
jgi:hypothetical protein